jgi:MFS transporter, NNP family, nitrate/nitrite transporter
VRRQVAHRDRGAVGVIRLAEQPLPVLLIGGVLLGLGGTTFAVGVPAVNAWFSPANRGMALGVFGIGTGGAAIASFATLPLADAFGQLAPFMIVSLALAVVAALSWTLLSDPADRVVPQESAFHRATETLRRAATWELSVLYALTFGGFVAFSVYLPTYLKSAYDLSPSDASMRTAGFVLLAIVARPISGWLCDRVHPANVLGATCLFAALFAGLAAVELPLIPFGTIAFLGLAAVLGAGAGAVFALVAKVAPVEEVGAVTGLVGAAGGLGGFFPPLVMGAIYGSAGDYTWGFVLLALAALGCAVLTYAVVRREASE